jgi:CheY-like chemotaxis protein
MDRTPRHATVPTVLIIEDSPVVQHLLRVTLAALEVELLFADCGETGLELVRTHRPDLITLDIGLPGIDGWHVLAEVRADPETSDIGVIVLTAHAQKSMQQAAEDSGTDGFFAKPFQPAELRKAVESLLDRIAIDAVVNL